LLIDFHPVFDLLAQEEDPPEILLYLTDGFGSAPKNMPPYPVIWGLIEGGVKPVKWGHLINIELGD